VDLDISYAEAGLLFALPVLLMGLGAAPGSRVADRLGTWSAIALGLLLIVVGVGLRAVAPNYVVMLALTVVFSTGIGLAQPSLPRLVRQWFPRDRASATGVYTAGLGCGAILAAATTGPLLVWLGPISWRGTCLVWAALAAVGLAIWLALGPRRAPPAAPVLGGAAAGEVGGASAGASAAQSTRFTDRGPDSPIWRDRTAWLITLVFLGQGIIFYEVNGWVPTYYQELGVPVEAAGLPLAVFNLIQLPMALIVPVLSDRLRVRRPFLLFDTLIVLVGLVGLIVLPLQPLWLWTLLMGVGLGGLFPIALSLPIDLQNPRRAAAVVSLELTVGYAAILPSLLLMGALRDALGSFTLAWTTGIACGLVLLVVVLLLPETGRGLADRSR
jgi:CP family cyanate transporter-like MFS transporter